jgi:hypothetical protein
MITSDATEEPDLQLAVGGFRHLAARFVGDMQDLLDAMQATIDGSAELLSTIGAEELAKLGEESICNGCGMDTTPYDDHHRPVPGWEWYHVRDEVWEAAQKHGPVRFLCVGCLEQRIGRRLVPGDFDALPIDKPSSLDTKRPVDRLGYGGASGASACPCT